MFLTPQMCLMSSAQSPTTIGLKDTCGSSHRMVSSRTTHNTTSMVRSSDDTIACRVRLGARDHGHRTVGLRLVAHRVLRDHASADSGEMTMAIELTDDGTFDTVLRCTECGAEMRYNYDGEPDGQHSEDSGDGYDAFIAWAIEDAESEHVCASDEPSEPEDGDLTTTDHETFY